MFKKIPEPKADKPLDVVKPLAVGDVVQLEEKYLPGIKSLIEHCEIASVAFQESARCLKATQKDLWKYIAILKPETKNFKLTFNHKTKQIPSVITTSDPSTKINWEISGLELIPED